MENVKRNQKVLPTVARILQSNQKGNQTGEVSSFAVLI
jgi:hypothetical protein